MVVNLTVLASLQKNRIKMGLGNQALSFYQKKTKMKMRRRADGRPAPKFYYTIVPALLSMGKLHKLSVCAIPKFVHFYPLTFGGSRAILIMWKGKDTKNSVAWLLVGWVVEWCFPHKIKKIKKKVLTNSTKGAIIKSR